MAIIGASPPKIWAQERYFQKDVHTVRTKPSFGKLHGHHSAAEHHSLVKDDLSHKGNSHVRANGDFDDVENVQSLKTPRLAKNEQLWEEVLRIFQKDGMIERLEALLVPLDTTNTGTVSSEDFIAAITRSELISLRLTEFLRDQRWSKGTQGVDYLSLLERLKIERNRKLGSLQRARDVFRTGLMRWQKNLLWRHFVHWSVNCGPGADIA